MPNFDKNRIFNESPTKVLQREYNNLKQDFSKLNAIKYKQFYENASLSFILENSNLIFTEPYKGLEFYTTLMKESVLPFNTLEREIAKVNVYLNEHSDQMSEVQKNDYNALLNVLQERYNGMKNSSCLYDTLMEHGEETLKIYDEYYEYIKKCCEPPKSIQDFMESEDLNLLDTLNIIIGVPELHSEMVTYLESCYYESPSTPDEYAMNAYVTNVISRMMKDSYFSERVSRIGNMNLRHLIMGLGGVKNSEMVDEILTERVKNFDVHYSSPENSVNRIFEDDVYAELLEDVNSEEKVNRLLCEKAVLDMNIAFLTMDFLHEGIISHSVNSIVEQVCIESTTIEKIPQDISGQIKILQEKIEEIETSLSNINEKYFTADGSASRIVSYSVGKTGRDNQKEDPEKEPEETTSFVPKRKSVNPNMSSEDDPQDTSDDEEKEADTAKDPEEDDNKKKDDAKKKRDNKYASMDVDTSEFDSLTESDNNDDDDEKSDSSENGAERNVGKIQKPEKRPFFQRVQNKALDANVKFKKTVAKGRRNAQDARNAGKAISKIPANITDSLKRTVSKWDELDDDRRKEYIIQPGVRKKYFKALQLAIMHGVAWSINPLLNIVLAICNKISANKDERIKNELIRELKAEIKVTEEKIEDAKGNPDDRQQKYKLMRIKEKLEAELARVTANAKYI